MHVIVYLFHNDPWSMMKVVMTFVLLANTAVKLQCCSIQSLIDSRMLKENRLSPHVVTLAGKRQA